MVAHKKKLHLMNDRAETFKCRECHKVFATALSLSTHYRIHITPSAMMPTAPIPQIASTTHISSSFGIGMLSHTHHQGTISMIHSHTQRLHPY